MIAVLRERLKGLKSFDRGIHPPYRKKLAKAQAIQLYQPTGQLVLPLSQHIGAPCQSKVEPKQEVAFGELIGDSDVLVSAPIHATLAGVTGLATVALLPNGRRVAAIPLTPTDENPLPSDFLQRFLNPTVGGKDPNDYDPDQIRQVVRDAGIVGMGGAAFPTHIKLVYNPGRPIEQIILNGAECEPYLTADHRLMVESPEAIVFGFQLAARAIRAKRAIIAIEENKPDAIDAIRSVAKDRGIEVVVCATKYPMGGERQLIPAVLGKVVPSAPRIPLSIGVAVTNVATAHAIARAVVEGAPLTHRVVTVSGYGVREPGNFLTPFGTMFSELIAAAGGAVAERVKVLAGGPMMGPTVPSLDIPVVKGTSGITVLTEKERATWRETPCIRCGKCIDNCPLWLSPTKIAHAVKHREHELADELNMNACCECGCCSFVCPAEIALAHYIRAGKSQWRAIAAKK